MTKMTDDDLRSVVEYELAHTSPNADDDYTTEQQRNLRYYLGQPLGNEIDGRSKVVSWDVFEVIEQAMTDLIEPFFAADHIAQFTGRQVDDERFAELATEYCNYIVKDENRGFRLFQGWFKDALISKVGVVRADWAEQPRRRIKRSGMVPEQLALWLQQPGVEVVAQTQAEDGTLSVEVLAPAEHRVEIRGVEPANFFITHACADPDEARLIGEYVVYTRSELREMGFDGDVKSFSGSALAGLLDDEPDVLADNPLDPSQEEVRLFRGFVRADVDGDGIAEWRRVLVGGDAVLENERVEYQTYCLLTPIPLPHRVVGMAYADPAVSLQDQNTAVLRQYLDSLYAANNPFTYVNMSAQVNVDDLLKRRIGGIVRGKGPAHDAIQPIVTTPVANEALQGLELGRDMRENRLGITRYNQGLDADSLNKTATGVQSIQRAGDRRQKMTLRVFAETGVRALFRLVLRLVCDHQDRPRQLRLAGQVVEFNPALWSPDMDVVCDVGIGTGDKSETALALREFAQYMLGAEQRGLATPEQYRELGLMLGKALGIRGVQQKLLPDPKTLPPPPPPPPIPQVQIKQMELQADAQRYQAEWQQRAQELQIEHAAKMAEINANMQTQATNDARDAEREALRIRMEAQAAEAQRQHDERMDAAKLEFDRYKADLDAQVKLAIAEKAAAPALDITPLQAGLDELRTALSAPVEIVRGPDGRASGVKRGAVTRQIQRGPDGRAVGVA